MPCMINFMTYAEYTVHCVGSENIEYIQFDFFIKTNSTLLTYFSLLVNVPLPYSTMLPYSVNSVLKLMIGYKMVHFKTSNKVIFIDKFLTNHLYNLNPGCSAAL